MILINELKIDTKLYSKLSNNEFEIDSIHKAHVFIKGVFGKANEDELNEKFSLKKSKKRNKISKYRMTCLETGLTFDTDSYYNEQGISSRDGKKEYYFNDSRFIYVKIGQEIDQTWED